MFLNRALLLETREITETFDHMQQIEKNIKCRNVAWNTVFSEIGC